MLEKEKGIDAVIVATPDHTHAVITMAVMQAGKHVFCQKPLTHTIHEARKITEAARRYKVVTQMGNQGHSYESIRLLKEWLDDGAIGDVTRGPRLDATGRWAATRGRTSCSGRSRPTRRRCRSRSTGTCGSGPSPFRPYHPEYHPTKWRAWIDFGTGPLGDMGCHILDPAFWALELGAPRSVEATSTHYQPEVAAQTFPRASIVRYEFPARGSRPPVKLTWYDGRLLPPDPGGAGAGSPAAGQRGAADRDEGQDPARLARRRRRAPDPRDAHAGVQAAAQDAAPGHRGPRGRLDPRLQGRRRRDAALLARSSTAAR